MSVEEKKAHVAESSHFYDKEGNPVYEVPNASKPGEMRPTTLRDARKLALAPSTTTVMQILAKPQIVRYQVKQALYAGLTMPRPEGISDDDYLDALIADAEQHSRDSMELGTAIHAQVQGAYEGELWLPQYEQFVTATMNAINKEFGTQRWVPEKSFYHPLGYGGKVDLHAENGIAVIDLKTTSLNGDKLKKINYIEHNIQLASYRLGLGLERAALCNVYVSTTVPGETYVKVLSHEEALLATRQWISLFELWKLIKNYSIGE